MPVGFIYYKVCKFFLIGILCNLTKNCIEMPLFSMQFDKKLNFRFFLVVFKNRSELLKAVLMLNGWIIIFHYLEQHFPFLFVLVLHGK